MFWLNKRLLITLLFLSTAQISRHR